MSTTTKEAKWPLVVNLSNSIIGVSVLTMPFCLKQCGILLGALLILGSNILTRVSCHLLMKGSHLTRRRTYEYYALHVFGSAGKTLIEVLMIFFLLSTLCAFFVVIGDLGPHIVVDFLGMASVNPQIRVAVMVLIGITIILPLSLLRNIESLNHVSSTAILFYAVFVLRMLLACLPKLLEFNWMDQVNWWRPGGVLQCLPIFALSLSCQTQLFVMADCMVDSSPVKMDAVVAGAVNLCSSVYLSVGFFGYVAFSDQLITGDILLLLESSYLTQLLKIGFMLSVAVSFPLMLFPCRAAIFTMFFRPAPPSAHDLVVEIIPEGPFKLITIVLLTINLIIAILIPNVEFILGITGSLIGSTICVILPSIMFLKVSPEHQFYSRIASQICLVVGLFILVVCTFAVLHSQPAHDVPIVPVEPLKKINQISAGTFEESKNIVQREVPEMARKHSDGGEKVEVKYDPQRKEPALPLQPQQPNKEGAQEVRKDEVPHVPPKSGEKDANAAKLLSELKEQQLEQKKLIEEQKELIEKLKEHHEIEKHSERDQVNASPVKNKSHSESDANRDQVVKREAKISNQQEGIKREILEIGENENRTPSKSQSSNDKISAAVAA